MHAAASKFGFNRHGLLLPQQCAVAAVSWKWANALCRIHCNPAAFASQRAGLQCSCDSRDQWLECARAAFASMDSAEKGHITSSQLVSMLSTKLPAEEVEHAVEDALMEAGCGGESVMFLRFMCVYVRFIRCMPLHTSKQSQRAAHVYSTL